MTPVLNANGVDCDQMLHSVESDLGLHCLPSLPFYGSLGINGLRANSADDKLIILFFPENSDDTFHANCLLGKLDKYFKMVSAEIFTWDAKQ